MSLNQMQTIQSLGNNLAMLQQEVETFGVSATETRHLVGRIGELYACVITNGQMALSPNQKGYDVVSAKGERISVKTTATKAASGSANFNENTLNHVDRIMIMRINEDLEIEVLFDQEKAAAMKWMVNGKISYSKIIESSRNAINLANIPVVRSVDYQGHQIQQYENGSIIVKKGSRAISPARPMLRAFARSLNLSRLNPNGNEYNTRQMGYHVINAIIELGPD